MTSLPTFKPSNAMPSGRGSVRVLVGCVLWAVSLAAGWWAFDSAGLRGDPDREGLLPVLWDYGTGERTEATLTFGSAYWTRVGDPIFVQTAAQPFVKVGVITSLAGSSGPIVGARARSGAFAVGATALLYPTAPPLGPGARVAYYRSDNSIAWILQTMLPTEKRQRLIAELRTTVERHSEEIFTSLLPIVRASLKDALTAVETELPGVIRAHRAELQALGAAYQERLIQKEVVPLVRNVIFPIAERRATPLATSIGKEIWTRVSLWRIGSRFLWDKVPGTEGDSLEREWRRVLKEEAIPVIEEHTDDLVGVVREIVIDASKNQQVRSTMRRAFGLIVEDRELHALVWSIFRQAVIDNTRLHEALSERWRSERARRVLDLASDRLEPTVISIGNQLFGTRDDGITPEFAVVLRNRLLLKDRQWFVLEPGVESELVEGSGPVALEVRAGADPADPFVPVEGR